jgi:predicted DNA-binding WGR domain protein
MLWEAYEFHQIDHKHARFCRLVLANTTVLKRTGNMGTYGKLHVDEFSTELQAKQHVAHHLSRPNFRRKYEEIYRDVALNGTMVPGPSPFPTTPADIERVALDRWRVTATKGITGTPYRWVILTNLLVLSKRDLSARFALEALQSGPHAINHTKDMVIGAANNPHDIKQSMVPVSDLGRIESSDSVHTIAAALSLYLPDARDPAAFMKVARRLGAMPN